VTKGLRARIQKLEQTERRSTIPPLIVRIHRNGCTYLGTCDDRCRRLTTWPCTEAGIRRECEYSVWHQLKTRSQTMSYDAHSPIANQRRIP